MAMELPELRISTMILCWKSMVVLARGDPETAKPQARRRRIRDKGRSAGTRVALAESL
jgi:hypothetical protein